MPRDDPGHSVPIDLDGFEKLLEHRLRLTLCVLLARYDLLSFSRLKLLTGETDGNLGANLRKLEDAEFLTATKEFQQRKPVTWYQLTAGGRARLKRHLDALARLIHDPGSLA